MPDAPSGYARGSVICFVLKALNFWGSFGCWNVEVEWENFKLLGCFLSFSNLLGLGPQVHPPSPDIFVSVTF